MFKLSNFIKSMLIILFVVSGYIVSISLFAIPKIEDSIHSLEAKNVQTILNEVVSRSKKVHENIKVFENIAIDIQKKNIKDINYLAYLILQNNYKKYKSGELTQEVAKRLAYAEISSLRYGNNGYFFIVDDNYIVLSHPDKEFMLKNTYYLRDINNKYFLREMIDKARKNNESYVQYIWTKKNKETFEKLSYINKFTPWNIYVGTGVNIENIRKVIEKRKTKLFDYLHQLIVNTKIGKSGYMYVLNSEGLMIYHPDSSLEGYNVSKLINPGTNTFLHNDLMNAYRTTKELRYKWNRPNDKKNYTYEKISWIEYIPELDWYIVSSSYLSEFEQNSYELKKSLIITTVVLLLIAIIVSSFFFKKLDKQMEEKAREIITLKERMELAIEGNRDVIWDWDLKNNKLFVTQQWKDIIGYDSKDVPYEMKIWRKHLHPDDIRNVLNALARNIKGKTEYIDNEHRIRHKDGSYRWIHLRGKTQYDSDGKPSRVTGTQTDITKEKELQGALEIQKDVLDYQAHHDALTGLPNRVLFNDRLEQAIEKSKRNKSNIALLFIDLDHFKEINDSLGHGVGDEILKAVTLKLNSIIRNGDTLARLGGDEFTIIMENLSLGQDASSLAQKILEVLAKPIIIDGNTLYISSSIGISLYPDDGLRAADLLKYSDAAMYKAKDEGRNNFQFYSSEMTQLAFDRVVMEANLRDALREEEFVVYYQAQVDGKTNKLIGMEALVRWQHPTMGLVSPAKFIPLAESTGLIVELDRYVMSVAMKQFSLWYKEGFNPGILAMNLAIKQLYKKDFIEVFQNLIEITLLESKYIELEVTESQIMTDPKEAIEILNTLNKMGISLAVDDFGTGYSSLSYLKKLPIDKLKIDQSFIRDLPNNEDDISITKAIIAMAKSLKLRIIAEGVENLEQKEFLVENGCSNIQGYFYSKPVPSDEMEIILREGFNS